MLSVHNKIWGDLKQSSTQVHNKIWGDLKQSSTQVHNKIVSSKV